MTNEPSPQRPRYRSVIWAMLAIPLVIVVGLLLLFSYITWSSRNVRFVIGPQDLTIESSLYGRSIPREMLQVEQARLTNLNADKALAIARRTNGTSVPGYSEGWFRLADGRKALAFVTERREVIYVPTSQDYVILISPTKPEVFLATLKTGTNMPVTFSIVPASFGAGLCLLAGAIVPLLVLAPIFLVAARQRRAVPTTTEPGVLYADRLVEISDEAIVFRHYYFPIGSKRVRFQEIERIETFALKFSSGAWRIWGSGDLQTWFPADWNRPNRDIGFRLIRRGKWMRIGFTVEDAETVKALLRRMGLLRE